MSLTMNAAISKCPRSLFGDRDKGIPPKYRKIFATVAKAILKDAGEKFDEATVDLVAAYINPSSMQRSVAGYRETLTGKFDRDTGKYLPVEEKVIRPKKARGQPRPEAVDDLGLGAPKRVKKPAKGLKVSKKLSKKLAAKAKKADKPTKTPSKAPGKAAKAPEVKKVGQSGLSAIAAARAALAAKKASKAKSATKAPTKANAAEESVEI